MYDPRLGRWFTTDAHASSYPEQSPYHFAYNNPNLFVDPDGNDNVIYLVALPSSETKFSKQDLQDIACQATENLSNLGLNTIVVVWDGSTISPSDIRSTDGVAFLGSVEDVKQNTKSFLGSDLYNAKSEIKSFQGGVTNPERSEVKSKVGQSIVGLDANSIEGFSESTLKSTKIEGAAYLINHGTGHNSGFIGHSDEVNGSPKGKTSNNASIMVCGGRTRCNITGKMFKHVNFGWVDLRDESKTQLNDHMQPSVNTLYVKQMESNFGTDEAVDYNEEIIEEEICPN